ncbi:MAG TPA: bacterioferritin [Candidatus Saccharimonadales bacterium]|nr:bacterioferritin [Candidatus Saccharimonadales bacterium]
MKGDARLLKTLNALLSDELTAINEYMVHSEMCDNWGYQRLHQQVEKRAVDEMRHAEKLIARILFLEGKPVVNRLGTIRIGEEVDKQFQNDLKSEQMAVQAYNEAVRQAVEVGDNGTRELLESVLKDEEAHVDWLEAQLDQIGHMGLGTYLSEQVKG